MSTADAAATATDAAGTATTPHATTTDNRGHVVDDDDVVAPVVAVAASHLRSRPLRNPRHPQQYPPPPPHGGRHPSPSRPSWTFRRRTKTTTTTRRIRLSCWCCCCCLLAFLGWVYFYTYSHWDRTSLDHHHQQQSIPHTTQQQQQQQQLSASSDFNAVQWYFNNMPVQYHQHHHGNNNNNGAAVGAHSQPQPRRRLPLGRVSCRQHYRHRRTTTTTTAAIASNSKSLLHHPLTTPWLTRTCVYTNLCFNVETREYLYFTDDDDETDVETRTVSIGGINPRWAWRTNATTGSTTTTATTADSDPWWNPMQWQPTRYTRGTTATTTTTTTTQTKKHNYTSFYQVTTHPPNDNNINSNNNNLHTNANVLLLFHSMAGHNVGHLLWDDLYPLYMALRAWGWLGGGVETDEIDDDETKTATVSPHANAATTRLWMMRHVLDVSPAPVTGDTPDDSGGDTTARTTANNHNQQQKPLRQHLYASCDIRQNKRKQCAANLQRFAVGMGIDPTTVATSKTARLHHHHQAAATIPSLNQNDIPTIQPQSSLVCFPQTLVGIGLATDHGLYDHGWEHETTTTTKATSINGGVPHNLGRGRLLYDFAQFWKRNINAAAATAATTTTTSLSNHRKTAQPKPPPHQITFSLRSSRDWARRLDFTDQIEALKSVQQQRDSSRVWNDDFTVKSYAMYELSLSEQVQVAVDTSIFVTACGGGSMTATFLPRHSVLIVLYDADGGLDFIPKLAVPNPTRPARLDADLLNHAAHVRVHWVPAQWIRRKSSTLNSNSNATIMGEDSTKLFLALIRHELAVLRRIKES